MHFFVREISDTPSLVDLSRATGGGIFHAEAPSAKLAIVLNVFTDNVVSGSTSKALRGSADGCAEDAGADLYIRDSSTASLKNVNANCYTKVDCSGDESCPDGQTPDCTSTPDDKCESGSATSCTCPLVYVPPTPAPTFESTGGPCS